MCFHICCSLNACLEGETVFCFSFVDSLRVQQINHFGYHQCLKSCCTLRVAALMISLSSNTLLLSRHFSQKPVVNSNLFSNYRIVAGLMKIALFMFQGNCAQAYSIKTSVTLKKMYFAFCVFCFLLPLIQLLHDTDTNCTSLTATIQVLSVSL